MIQFRRLRLSGFKSFVERTELDIAPGLTGIVGPNGCGKSNIVEALRWVMGENSARRMRGDDMDDVIFAGTQTRPARSIAEVSLLLDNAARTAPAAYNGSDEIEIIRKIEREQGSTYRINGRVVRARDVQLLFADTVTGSNSPALVSQGRVTALIAAKPSERRLVLEESAGISGLYARRGEAEMRLRAADSNLARLEDLTGSMTTRLTALKKQARQAARYRDLGERIRNLDIVIGWMEWQGLFAKEHESRKAFAEAESRVAAHLQTVTQLTRTQTTQAKDLPALRQDEAQAAARLQAFRIALHRYEEEERHLAQSLKETADQLRHIDSDIAHETTSIEENTANLARNEKTGADIRAAQDGESEELARKTALRESLDSQVQAAESAYTRLTEDTASLRTRRESLERQATQERKTLENARLRAANAEKALAEKRARLDADDKEAPLRETIAQTGSTLAELQKAIDAERSALGTAEAILATESQKLKDSESALATLKTEINTLRSVLESENDSALFRPILEDVHAQEGFEIALSKALGESLMASMDPDAPTLWRERDPDRPRAIPLPTLPEGVSPLSDRIKAPPALHDALSQIGIVTEDPQGHALFDHLAAGQSLVSVSGAYWRWDGLQIKASAADRHAARLRQKNRLQDLESRLPAQDSARDSAFQIHQAALKACEDSRQCLRGHKEALAAQEQSLSRARTQLHECISAQAGLKADIARLEESAAQSRAEETRLAASLATLDSERAGFDEAFLSARQTELSEQRTTLQTLRGQLQTAIRACDACRQEQDSRRARLHAIADERLNLQNRSIRARERLKTLQDRRSQTLERRADLEKTPRNGTKGREDLLSQISEAETARRTHADALAKCESGLTQTGRALKEAESLLAKAREDRAGAHARVLVGQENLDSLRARIAERFDCNPEDLLRLQTEPRAFSAESLADQEVDSLRAEREKLSREREAMGAVNLRADIEAEELDSELGGVLREREDLVQAIAELRQGIQKLNREARERLARAFETVNGHFQDLFTRLYGGGQAHLALTDSDDPLLAGLEIFAQPPGKTLQSLSLMSGGEQTLASIALIFAMFLTNPAPICVLDEIDAQLDDSNVDRVCDLLEDLAARARTRFLIITHHRLTMARMDRLYGVTMAEQGISRLVSVDLQASFAFMEAAE